MSNNRKREWLDVTRLEFRHSYRSPLVEFITVFFLYIAFSATYAWASRPLWIGTIPGPTWNGTAQIDYFQSFMNSISTTTLVSSLDQLWAVIMFIMPLIVAFTTARSFEDGSLRTLLSYPVERTHLLLMRILVPFLIIGGISTLSVLLAQFLMVPAVIDIGAFLSYFGIFYLAIILVIASISLLAIVTKRMMATAVGGVAVWYGLLIFSWTSACPRVLFWIMNPIYMFSQYNLGGELAPVLGDVLYTIGVMSVMVVVFILSAIMLFKKVEV
ncbi:MAG: hypothetical protein ACTSXE_02425 [Candidatus Thorarchaeota archaeon]